MTEVQKHSGSKEVDLKLSESAKQHILNYLSKQDDCKGVRFSVKKTGCSGLSYVVDYLKEPLETDMTVSFEKDYLMCIDKKSLPFLNGMTVDYVKKGLNYQFVFDNPNQTGACGCGESFTVD